jgi:hypothetical protein
MVINAVSLQPGAVSLAAACRDAGECLEKSTDGPVSIPDPPPDDRVAFFKAYL